MSWYESTTDPHLHQGDILRDCPVFSVSADLTWPLTSDDLDVVEKRLDVVVLTQTCDIENDKVEEILVAQVSDYLAMVDAEAKNNKTFPASSKFRRLLIDGNVPGMFLLRKQDAGDPRMGWAVVNFHRLYTLPKKFAETYAQQGGARLRLVSPYRELLSQAFGRYFMRVALPVDARAFETEGEPKKEPKPGPSGMRGKKAPA